MQFAKVLLLILTIVKPIHGQAITKYRSITARIFKKAGMNSQWNHGVYSYHGNMADLIWMKNFYIAETLPMLVTVSEITLVRKIRMPKKKRQDLLDSIRKFTLPINEEERSHNKLY